MPNTTPPTSPRRSLYEQQLREAETAINNLLNAIQQGILTRSTKERFEELEARRDDLETKLACKKLAKPKVRAEFMTFWLHRFRKLDVRQKDRVRLCHTCFVVRTVAALSIRRISLCPSSLSKNACISGSRSRVRAASGERSSAGRKGLLVPALLHARRFPREICRLFLHPITASGKMQKQMVDVSEAVFITGS